MGIKIWLKFKMDHFKKNSGTSGLKVRFLAPTLAIIFSATLTMGVVFAATTFYISQELLESKSQTMFNFLSQVSAKYVENFDTTALTGFVNELQNNPDVAYVAFFDKDHKAIAESVKGGVDVSSFRFLHYESKLHGAGNTDIGKIEVAYKKDSLFINLVLNIFYSIIGALLCLVFIGTKVSKALSEKTDALTGVGNRLRKSSLELTEAAAVIGIVSEKLARSSSETDVSLQSTRSSIQEITVVIKQTSKNTDSALIKAKAGQKAAFEGLGVVQQFEKAMKDVADSNKKLEVIQQVVDKIDAKTQIIGEIVFSTRLLSFNASIEAEKAQVNGRCFAVVAAHVGKLADVSGGAAKEISGFLQKSKTLVSNTISETGAKADVGERISVICGEVFEKITDNIKEMEQKVSAIYSDTENQESGMAKTSAVIDSLCHISTQNTQLANQANQMAASLQVQAVGLRSNIAALEAIIDEKKIEVA